MIFVTVGTHEQPFDRLIEYVDHLKRDGIITEGVVMQIGFGTYNPQHCQWQKFYSYVDMEKYMFEARIVITHGGPSSFLLPLQIGKIPIVVPRQKQFNEHVNDHQVDFSKAVAKHYGGIIVIENIDDLKDTILNYDKVIRHMPMKLKSNNAEFCRKFEGIVAGVMKEGRKWRRPSEIK